MPTIMPGIGIPIIIPGIAGIPIIMPGIPIAGIIPRMPIIMPGIMGIPIPGMPIIMPGIPIAGIIPGMPIIMPGIPIPGMPIAGIIPGMPIIIPGIPIGEAIGRPSMPLTVIPGVLIDRVPVPNGGNGMPIGCAAARMIGGVPRRLRGTGTVPLRCGPVNGGGGCAGITAIGVSSAPPLIMPDIGIIIGGGIIMPPGIIPGIMGGIIMPPGIIPGIIIGPGIIGIMGMPGIHPGGKNCARTSTPVDRNSNPASAIVVARSFMADLV